MSRKLNLRNAKRRQIERDIIDHFIEQEIAHEAMEEEATDLGMSLDEFRSANGWQQDEKVTVH